MPLAKAFPQYVQILSTRDQVRCIAIESNMKQHVIVGITAYTNSVMNRDQSHNLVAGRRYRLSNPPRLGSRDRRRWNQACDFAINARLIEQGFRLPRGGLHCRALSGLPAEAIYPLLIDDTHNDSVASIE